MPSRIQRRRGLATGPVRPTENTPTGRPRTRAVAPKRIPKMPTGNRPKLPSSPNADLQAAARGIAGLGPKVPGYDNMTSIMLEQRRREGAPKPRGLIGSPAGTRSYKKGGTIKVKGKK